MSTNTTIELILKKTIQTYIDNHYPGIEFMLFRFNSGEEYKKLTGNNYWSKGYVVEYHGKGKKQKGTISNTSLLLFADLGEDILIKGIEKHTKLCIGLLLNKIAVETSL